MPGKQTMFEGDVFNTKYGPCVVVSYKNARNVSVVFTNTGFTSTFEAADIRKNNVKDLLYPSVVGKGYIGKGPYKASINRKATREYDMWQHMLRRCYCEKLHKQKPYYKDCSVEDRWLNFQNFCEDLPKIPGYERFEEGLPCHLDKDIRVKGNRTYGLSFCKITEPSENCKAQRSKNESF